jgi:hypothetical protein
MRFSLLAAGVLFGLALVFLAPVRADDSKDKEAKIKENLAKLDAKDRKLAEAQKFCVIEHDTRLGQHGKPIKIVVKGEPVFVCCDDCKEEVEKNPDKALAKAKELRAKYGKK